jgi:hypothetical protein
MLNLCWITCNTQSQFKNHEYPNRNTHCLICFFGFSKNTERTTEAAINLLSILIYYLGTHDTALIRGKVWNELFVDMVYLFPVTSEVVSMGQLCMECEEKSRDGLKS